MHVSEVSYKRLFTIKKFDDNVTIGAVVALGEDDSPDEAYARAKAFVDALGKHEIEDAKR